jgi:AcrR family transcriptional regulator
VGRPPKHSSPEASRERILEAAADVFAELGYEGASIRAICKRARLNGAAVNYHFDSKERVWLAATEHISRRLQPVVLTAILPGRPVREAVRAFLDQLFDAFVADRRLARLLMWGTLQAGRLDFDRTLGPFASAIELGIGYFMAAQASGEIPADIDIAVVCPFLFGLFVYTFLEHPNQSRVYGAGLDDPAVAARVKAGLLRSAERLLGLDAVAAKRA